MNGQRPILGGGAEPTPVEVWAPAFEWLDELTPGSTQSVHGDAVYCLLCEREVPFAPKPRRAHVRQHAREREAWRRGRRSSAERENTARLRQINALRREVEATDPPSAREGASGSAGTVPADDQGGSRMARKSRTKAAQAAATNGGKKEEQATAKKAEAAVAKATGPELFTALIGRVKAAKLGQVVEHPRGVYARIQRDSRTVAYVVRGKTKLNVYPQALANQVPKDVGFKKVALGSHHYGKGEVIVPVEAEGDFDAALKAIEASAKLPAPEKKRAEKPKAAAGAKAK